MTKYAADNVNDLHRYIDDEMWIGRHWSDSREDNKALAKYLRSLGIPARAITLPETSNTNYGMNAPERYVIYTPYNLPSSHNIHLRIYEWQKQSER